MAARNSVSVRRATGDDLDHVASVWHQSASAMDAAAPHMPTYAEMRVRVDRELEAGWQLFLAEEGGRVVGILALRPGDAVLDQIFVLPERQASGIGTMLMNLAKEVMPNGFSLRMAEGNERAAHFYQRTGLNFRRRDTHPVSGRPVCFYDWKRS